MTRRGKPGSTHSAPGGSDMQKAAPVFGFRIQGFEFRVEGFRVEGFGFKVEGFRLRVSS